MIVKLFASLLIIVPLYAQRVTTELYNNGKVRSEGVLNDGQKIGEWKYFYPNGNRMAIENYENGILNGAVTYFFPGSGIPKLFFKLKPKKRFL